MQNLNYSSTQVATTNRVNNIQHVTNTSSTVNEPDSFEHNGITVKGNVHDLKANFNGGFQCFACDLQELNFWKHLRAQKHHVAQYHQLSMNEMLKAAARAKILNQVSQDMHYLIWNISNKIT